MTIAPIPILGSNPGIAFQNALEYIRGKIASRGEIPQVRNLVSDSAINELNLVAATQYDSSACAVQFYGGMIHRYPEAIFKITDGKSKKRRKTTRELADFLVVAVFTKPSTSGHHVHDRSRACLIQAKLSDSIAGPTVLNLNTRTADTPAKTNEEQFYLLNRWPAFELKNEKPANTFKLKSIDNKSRPLGKYCFFWKRNSTRPASWLSSWQCGDPLPGSAATLSLGSLIADIIDSAPHAGRDFQSPPGDDWDRLMKQLTDHVSSNTWGGISKLADPAGVSLFTHITAFGTLMQNEPMIRNERIDNHWFDHGFPSFFSGANYPRFSKLENSGGMPVLIISVSSFISLEEMGELADDVKRNLAREAWNFMKNGK